jgi:hypothetical protein
MHFSSFTKIWNSSHLTALGLSILKIFCEEYMGYKGAVNARRIITPPEFVESKCENFVENSSAFNCCEHYITSTTTSATLETIEVVCKSWNSYRVSVATSVLGRLIVRAVTG